MIFHTATFLPLFFVLSYFRRSHAEFVAFLAPEYVTGPVTLTRAVNCWNAMREVDDSLPPLKVLPPSGFYPYSWVNGVEAADAP